LSCVEELETYFDFVYGCLTSGLPVELWVAYVPDDVLLAWFQEQES
jgi:hypothetical protein